MPSGAETIEVLLFISLIKLGKLVFYAHQLVLKMQKQPIS
jgi:uncharacterized phage-associated protein